jgi:phage shock protein PspC (stress-responsive transcriptional regulator)
MTGGSATASARSDGALRRDPERGVLAGVCAGIARRYGIDPLMVRVAFVVAAVAGGIGVAVYALAWLLMPAEEDAAAPARSPRTGRGAIEVALGVAFLLLSVLLALRESGLWFSDALVWPLVLVAAGAALI